MNCWEHENSGNFNHIFHLYCWVGAQVGGNGYTQHLTTEFYFQGKSDTWKERPSRPLLEHDQSNVSWRWVSLDMRILVLDFSFDMRVVFFDFSWNESCILRFLISNTDHIIDVNKATAIHEYDTINIVCPKYDKETEDERMERHVIYNVNKEEYDTCRILSDTPRIIGFCTEPTRERCVGDVLTWPPCVLYVLMSFIPGCSQSHSARSPPSPTLWSLSEARATTSSPPPAQGTCAPGRAGTVYTTTWRSV